jgi:hypothetical protein
MDRAILTVGSVLTVAPLVVAAFLLRPRPSSWLEAVYVAVPLAGSALLVAAAWVRF